MQFYSVQAKENIEVPDDQVERTTMANGRPAARATIERDGKTLKLFKFLPSDAAASASATAAADTSTAKPKKKANK
jgi:hypothetical protein